MRLIEYLFFPPGPVGPVFDRWGGALFGAFVGLGVGLLFWRWVMHTLNGRHGLKRKVTDRISLGGTGLQALGILLLALRYANVPVLSMRILLYALLAAEVVGAIFAWLWLRDRYPELLAQYEWEEKKRSYLPRSVGGAVEPPRRRQASRRRR